MTSQPYLSPGRISHSHALATRLSSAQVVPRKRPSLGCRDQRGETPEATAFPPSPVIGQSRSRGQADVGGSGNAVLCRTGRVGGERLCDLKNTIYYTCLSVFF